MVAGAGDSLWEWTRWTSPAYMGFDNGWRNVGWELEFTLCAVLMIGAIWAAGWFVNRPWSWPLPVGHCVGRGLFGLFS